jgi:transposase-like protein
VLGRLHLARAEAKRDRSRTVRRHQVMSRGVSLKKAFLAAYAKTCSIMRAAEAAGIDRRTHYRWLKDANYKEQFLEAQEQLSARSKMKLQACHYWW